MFIVILSAVLGLMHLYVWKRLVKDTTPRDARGGSSPPSSSRSRCCCSRR